jgi:hypothetical protein
VLREVIGGLERGKFLGDGGDDELIERRSVLPRDRFDGLLQRSWQTQREVAGDRHITFPFRGSP